MAGRSPAIHSRFSTIRRIALPPSSLDTLRHFSRIAEKQSVAVELITRKQLAEFAQFDALFIRATTSIDSFTYRFAQPHRTEGMPVIDDPQSMIRCTNKVYLHELLEAHGVPVPPTVMLAEDEDLIKAERLLGWPMVLKIPDGSFSRGVRKVETAQALKALSDELFEDTDLLLAQKVHADQVQLADRGARRRAAVRVPVSDGARPLADHQARPNGAREGGSKTIPIADAPPRVIDAALKAARAMGPGLYGVDIKETDGAIVVIEVNDNPNLERGEENLVGKDEVWTRLLNWFIKRIDA